MISCHQHDYVEIACLYHLALQLKLKDGSTKNGVAQTTQYNADKQECLVIDVEHHLVEIILDEVLSMKAFKSNPHFDLITFNNSDDTF